MIFHVVTLFPESFASYLNESIIGRAQRDGLISVQFYNPRDFVKISKKESKKEKPYKRVDDKPYGGGPGMVMQAEPVVRAVEKALSKISAGDRKSKTKIIFFSPSGKQFTNTYAQGAAKKYKHIIFICGRYEGVDARVKKIFKAEELSVGPFVLTGGELPAMIVIDTISRQIKGVLGNFDSREEARIASSEVYTRPEVYVYKGKKYRVPKVLTKGNHADIEKWRNGRNSNHKA